MDASFHNSRMRIEDDELLLWRDLLCAFSVNSTGNARPSYGLVFDSFEGYLFSHNTMNQVMCEFHIGHDIALDTKVFPHVHWTPTTNNAGVVRWGFEYSIAKGHQQAAGSDFTTPVTIYVDHAVSLGQSRRHFVTEVPEVDGILSNLIEPDTVMKIRIFRDATHVNDTFPTNIHAWQADLHYQRVRSGTKNRAPDFYA